MKHLMEEVFQVLYDRDSEMLGTIIKEYGYFDETPQKKEYDFEGNLIKNFTKDYGI